MEACDTIDLAAFVAQTLTPEQREAVERHLDRCGDCRSIAVSLVVPPERLPLPRLHPGDRVDQYTITGFVGAGGMGSVYEAEDRDLGRRVALKVLDPQPGQGDEARQEREARALARLSHPNVVTVFGVGRIDGATYLSTEILDGATLRRWVLAHRPAPRELLDAFVGIARALQATHDAGLVHRDVKPDNVIVTEAGVPTLIDFGLARQRHRGAGSGGTEAW